jgi:hypothetical protein
LALIKSGKLGDAYLKLDLGLSNILLAATTVGDLLSLSNLVADSLELEHQRLVSHALSRKKVTRPTSALKSSRAKPSTALMLN